VYKNVLIGFLGPDPGNIGDNFYFTLSFVSGGSGFSGGHDGFSFTVPASYVTSATVKSCTWYTYGTSTEDDRTTTCTDRETNSYRAGPNLNFSGFIVRNNGNFYCVERVVRPYTEM
jgi:hypothetical protein